MRALVAAVALALVAGCGDGSGSACDPDCIDLGVPPCNTTPPSCPVGRTALCWGDHWTCEGPGTDMAHHD